ncbi:hypothetical protein M5D96_011876 [Drosophila gunungcola]|uniref:Uncharacterized protein n=1 Tax=Drosophila gunungcola TaxID=103775 RepID=A0A9P9YE80_9MUSC|nr:hypothetical protein M5D96_011876 [Drosophila gunungcola]
MSIKIYLPFNYYCRKKPTNFTRSANIALDRIMGMTLMLILFSLATQPGDFLIPISHVNFIEPLVRQVFLAIGAFGSLGLTFQIALLVDLISVIGLHSHCFYIYTKVLYNVERKGLSVLWQVVRGNRFNMLKGKFTYYGETRTSFCF